MATLKCVVVTPEQTVLETDAEFVALPLYDGEIGIAPGRGAMIGRLGYGEMRLRRGADVERWYVDGGFVQVDKDIVSVLTARAMVASQVNLDAAKEQIEAAMKKPSHTPELLEIRERAVAQGRAQVRVAQKAK